jgi:hypothetical protein
MIGQRPSDNHWDDCPVLGGGRVGRVRQPVPPPLPADATPIGPAAGLVNGADGVDGVRVWARVWAGHVRVRDRGRGRGRWLAAVLAGRHRDRLGGGGRGRVRDRADRLPAAPGPPGRQVRLDPATPPRRSGLGGVGGHCDGVGEELAFLVEQPGTLARMLRPHYSPGRADDEARALLREAFALSGDLHITGPAAHRDRNPLPRHQPDHQLRRQRPARRHVRSSGPRPLTRPARRSPTPMSSPSPPGWPRTARLPPTSPMRADRSGRPVELVVDQNAWVVHAGGREAQPDGPAAVSWPLMRAPCLQAQLSF